ncbi:MAG: IPTL-CTERM sorting domain-containing protein [Acidobacteriota bacterium]
MHSLRIRGALRIAFFALCALLLLGGTAQAQQIIIDDFGGTAQSVTATGVGNTDSDSAVDGAVLGGERDLLTTVAGGGGSIVVDVNSVGDPGVLTHAQGSGVTGTTLVVWDGADGDPLALDATGLGGLDLTSGGLANAFQLDIASDDLPIDIVLRVYTDAGNVSERTVSLPGLIGIGPNPPASYVIPFSAFAATVGAGADFSSVGAIEALIDGSIFSDVDLRVDLLATTATLDADKADALLLDGNMDGIVNPGDTVRYTVTLENVDDTADFDVTGVVYDSSVDPSTALVVGSVTTTQGTVTTGNTAGDTAVSVDVGTVPDGATVTITYDVIVADPLAAGITSITCQGLVGSDELIDVPTNDPDTMPDDDTTTTPVAGAPLIDATKADALLVDGNMDGTVNPGDTVRDTVVVTNSGNQDATFADFDTALDPETTLVVGSVTTTQGTVNVGNTAGDTAVDVSLGALPGGGGSATITFDVTVNDPVTPGTTEIICQGEVVGADFPDTPTDDPGTPADDDPTITPVGVPDVAATKVDTLIVDGNMNGLVNGGDTVRYTVELTNSGSAGATGVIFTSPVDANSTLVVGSVTTTQGTVTTGNTGGDTSVAVDVGTIAGSGGTVTITFDVTVVPVIPPGVTEIVCQGLVTGPDIPDTPTDDPGTPADDDPTDTPLAPEADVSATKADIFVVDGNGNGIANPNDTLRYTVVLTNDGDLGATGTVFTSPVDANTTLVVGSVTTSQGTVTTGNTGGDTSVAVDVGLLDGNGAAVTITFDVTINDPLPPGTTSIACQGLVTSPEIPDTPTDDPDSVPVDDPTITPAGSGPLVDAIKADAVVGDGDGDGLADAGDTIAYTVTITNSGDGDATGATFTSPIDPNTMLVVGSVTTSQGIVTTGNTAGDISVAVDIGTLAGSGGTVTITYSAIVVDPLPAGPPPIACQGTVTSGDLPSDVPTDDPDSPADDDPTITPTDIDPMLSAAKLAALTGDNDGDGEVSPGDVLSYTITIANGTAADATAVMFADTPDANTTLVVGSVVTTQGTVTSGNTAGDATVAVDIGTIVGGAAVTIDFDVMVNDPLPAGTTSIVNQGLVTSPDTPDIPTDDPSDPTPDDPTDTPVGPPIFPIPTLGEWGLLLLALLIGLIGIRQMRATA